MEALNDFERQDLKRNQRLIRSIGLERAVSNAKNSIEALRKAYLESFEGDPLAFDVVIKWIETLGEVKPVKIRRNVPLP